MAAGSSTVLGIDLGTSYSTAAAVIGGRMHYVLDSRGEPCFHSVVHFPKAGPPIVGVEADRLRLTDPQNTVFGIKRVIGRPIDSPQGRVLDANAAFKLRGQPGQGEAYVEVRTGTYAASEVASMILKHLRERAEARFGKGICKAVLTVPVGATPEVKQAMMRAGKMAGLEVLRIVFEPCAGAVARARGAGAWGAAPFLVFDFGGGTFDATVIQGGAERQLTPLASGGDDCLGGDDFDVAFARWVASGVHRVRGIDITRDAIVWDKVQRQCELVKRALSANPESKYVVNEAFTNAAPRDIDILVRRDHLVPVWAELVERSRTASLDTLAAASVSAAQLGAVLLIGGTSYIPQVRAAITAAIPRPCIMEDDPQTAVARGAALLGADASLLKE